MESGGWRVERGVSSSWGCAHRVVCDACNVIYVNPVCIRGRGLHQVVFQRPSQSLTLILKRPHPPAIKHSHCGVL